MFRQPMHEALLDVVPREVSAVGFHEARSAVRRLAVYLLCISLAACATTQQRSARPDLKWLQLGVDPEVEGRKVLRDYQAAGYSLHARVVGQGFTAMGFLRPDGSSRGVRVVTARGVVLALDSIPKGALQDRLEYFLMMPPAQSSLDADGDGREEFFVREVGRNAGGCIIPYRVLPGGTVRPVEADLARYGADACVAGLSDVDGNGEVELVVEYRVEGLPIAEWPEVAVLLFPDGTGGFDTSGPPAAMERYYVEEIERRRATLGERAAGGDVLATYRIATEIALLWHLSGAARATELRVLGSHFGELADNVRDRGIESAIVAHIQEGW